MKDKLILLIRDNPSVTIKELSLMLGISSGQVKIIILKLKKEYRLRRLGANKNGRWMLT